MVHDVGAIALCLQLKCFVAMLYLHMSGVGIGSRKLTPPPPPPPPLLPICLHLDFMVLQLL